jgi:hypothetical protein
MRNDPIYLSQALTCEASLGVLSVAGNFCKNIISDVSKYVNGSLLKLAFVLECLGDFSAVFEVKEVMPKSIEDLL